MLKYQKASLKNRRLGVLIGDLRDYLDTAWLVNQYSRKINKLSWKRYEFLGWVQNVSYKSAVIELCKIYEPEDRYERNSIWGVISSLKSKSYDKNEQDSILLFGQKYKISEPRSDKAIKGIFKKFTYRHRMSLKKLRNYRNKVGAHSEYLDPAKKLPTNKLRAFSEKLPSQKEMELLYSFAHDFCVLVFEKILKEGSLSLTFQYVHSSLENCIQILLRDKGLEPN
jgi:hypothetical protein